MEEEGGEEDTEQVGREKDEKKNVNDCVTAKISPIFTSKENPDPPNHKTDRADRHVEPCKALTKDYPEVSVTETSFTEAKEGYRGEDNEGGLSIEDL